MIKQLNCLVINLWNNKAWANNSNMLQQITNKYMHVIETCKNMRVKYMKIQNF